MRNEHDHIWVRPPDGAGLAQDQIHLFFTADNAQSPLDEPAEWGGKPLRAA